MNSQALSKQNLQPSCKAEGNKAAQKQVVVRKQEATPVEDHVASSRRALCSIALTAPALSLLPRVANAQQELIYGSYYEPPPPPEGFRLHINRAAGYCVFVPDYWVPQNNITQMEMLYRSVEEPTFLVYVNLPYANTTKFEDTADYAGTIEEWGQRYKKKMLQEMQTTNRIKIRRKAQLKEAAVRSDGEVTYYDTRVGFQSIATTEQFAPDPETREANMIIEYDRQYLMTVAVENGFVYELRIQVPTKDFERFKPTIDMMQNSFKVFFNYNM